MNSIAAVECLQCHRPLPWNLFNTLQHEQCPSCLSTVYAIAFPALLRPPSKGDAAAFLLAEGASCFFHPQRQAAGVCGYCGRFLCHVCDIDINGEHLCSLCVEEGQKKGRIKNLEMRRTLYDDMALSLALLPLLFFYFTIITAPIALYVSIRYWKAPSSILPRTKIRFIFAILFAGMELIAWGFLFFFLFSTRTVAQ
jgi:hypothetical protein